MKAVDISYLTQLDEIAEKYLALAEGTDSLYVEFDDVTIVARSGEVLGRLTYEEDAGAFYFVPNRV